MTRINTNVSSLVAQNRLNRTNAELNTSLTRLSTGLRINTGKDDPAGLIASEALRSDITSINKALSNTQRAGQIIATADSALGQVSSLLNDIRGLVVEASNNGALSDDEIAANQLQVDSSLEAINRISQTTTFQGRRLLDGSLDFVTSAGTGFNSVTDLKIDQANLGAAGQITVNVNISAAATKAEISTTGVPTATTPAFSTGTLTFGSPSAAAEASGTANFAASYTIGAEASGDITFDDAFTPDTQATGNLTLGSGVSITVTAVAGEAADGEKGNDTIIEVTTIAPGGASSATYDAESDTLSLVLAQGDDITAILADLSVAEFNFADNASGANVIAAGDAGTYTSALGTGTNATDPLTGFTLTARDGGAADGLKGDDTEIILTSGTTTSATYDAESDTLSITIAAGATIADIAAAINNDVGDDFIASNIVNGDYTYSAADNTAPGVPLLNALTGGTNPTLASSFDIEAVDGQAADGTAGNGVTLELTAGAITEAEYDAENDAINITVAEGATIQDIADAIDATGVFLTRNVQNGTAIFSTTELGSIDPGLAGGDDDTVNDVITVTADEDSAEFDGTTITVNAVNSLAAGTAEAELDDDGNIVVRVSNLGTGVTMGAIATAINGLEGFSASVTESSGDGVYFAGTPGADTAPVIANLAGGQFGGGLAADLDLRLTGTTGSEVFEFEKGTSLDLMIQSINLVSDATGIQAENDGGNLKLTSTSYGSDALIDIDVIREGEGGQFKDGLTAARANGTDVVATINGTTATGKGNKLSINTATLDLSLTVAEGSSSAINFSITGGGAQFQLGPEVVSSQQARLGITSVSTSKLGSANGRLYELGSGGNKALATDATGAARIINDVINVVTNLRGRLGAFQATTLESNQNSLNDTIANLTEAESSIRDADFAAESARLTRAQILVQSGTSVLGIANQNPQNVLGLLR